MLSVLLTLSFLCFINESTIKDAYPSSASAKCVHVLISSSITQEFFLRLFYFWFVHALVMQTQLHGPVIFFGYNFGALMSRLLKVFV